MSDPNTPPQPGSEGFTPAPGSHIVFPPGLAPASEGAESGHVEVATQEVPMAEQGWLDQQRAAYEAQVAPEADAGAVVAPFPVPDPPAANGDVPPEYAEEEVILRGDGMVLLKLSGRRLILRRPRFGELREIQESVTAIDEANAEAARVPADRIREMAAPVNERLAPLRTRAVEADRTGDPEAQALLREEIESLRAELEGITASDEYKAVLAEQRRVRDANDLAYLEWFLQDVLRRFTRNAYSLDGMRAEDLPVWCIDRAWLRDLIGHWSSVPRRPGAR